MSSFSKRLKELRFSRDISQAELSKRLEVSPSLISGYELGTRVPSFNMLEKISDFFNVDIDYLRGKQEATTEIVTGEAHLLLEIYKRLDDHSQALVLGYARGLMDLQADKESNDASNKEKD